MHRDYEWSRFQPHAYFTANYQTITKADRWIAEALLDEWGEISARRRGLVDAIDVGTGPNLYPALAALPYVRRLRLIEYAETNRGYLEAQRRNVDSDWSGWLDFFESRAPKTHGSARLRSVFAQRIAVKEGDIFALEVATADVAQMFFCAESITNDEDEFAAACQHLARAVRPGGNVIAAFMLGSSGYRTAGSFFPAVPISESHVRDALDKLCEIRRVEEIPGSREVRPGVQGMLFVVARRRDDGRRAPSGGAIGKMSAD